ncbi:MAG: hypothetical protein CMH60_01385 [Myxococcales bacterium]|nr:hypothetical protein [Myxococcales bacterium]
MRGASVDLSLVQTNLTRLSSSQRLALEDDSIAVKKSPAGSNVAALGPYYRHAKNLVEQGRYREAKRVLRTRLDDSTGALKIASKELLARCALALGGDWRSLMDEVKDYYRQNRDLRGLAESCHAYGVGLLAHGDLAQADDYLRRAKVTYLKLEDPSAVAHVESLRVRIRVRAGFILRAEKRIQRAIRALSADVPNIIKASLYLERARVMAYKQDRKTAVKDLMQAERYLQKKAQPQELLEASLTRSEVLIVLGENAKAHKLLNKLLKRVVVQEDRLVRAQIRFLLGCTLIEENQSEARIHFIQARHVYHSISSIFHEAHCDLRLIRLKVRMGVNPMSRLTGLRKLPLKNWPALFEQLLLAEAEVVMRQDSDKAQSLLRSVRRLCEKMGNQMLLRDIDEDLEELELRVSGNPMGSMGRVLSRPAVQVGSSSIFRGSSLQNPQPLPREGSAGRLSMLPRMPSVATFVENQVGAPGRPMPQRPKVVKKR